MSSNGKWVAKYGMPFVACLGIWATFAPDAVASSVNPALASLAGAFPDVPYFMITLVSTLPSLFIVIATLAIGPLLGKRVKFKPLALAAFSVALIAGIAPTFVNNFYGILISRCLFGLAVGLLAPVGPTLTMMSFSEGPARSNMLAVGNAVLNGFAIFTTLAAGVLSGIFWQYTFLIYMVNIISIILIALFLREPKVEKQLEEEVHEKPADRKLSKKGLPGIVIFDCVMFFLMVVIMVVPSINTSSVLAEYGLGTPAIAGICVLGQSFGSLVGNALFPFVLKGTKRFAVPVGFVVGAGAAVVWSTFGVQSAIGLFIGLFINGIALNIITPAMQNEISNYCEPGQMGLASSVFMSCLNLGLFCCTFYIALWMDVLGIQSLVTPVLCGAVLWLIMGAIVAAVQFKRPNPPTEWEKA